MSDESSQLRLKLQFYFIHKLKVLKNSHTNAKDIYLALEQVAFLINLSSSNVEIQQEFSTFSKQALQNEFKTSQLYQICFKEILSNLNMAHFSEKEASLQQIKNLLVQIIGTTNFSDSFGVLYDLCTSLKPGQHRDFILFLLRQFISKHLLQNLFIENTKFNANSLKQGQRQSLVEDQLIQKVINLPDKIANLFDPKTLNIHFTSKHYFKTVSTDLWLCLKHLHAKLIQTPSVFNDLPSCLCVEFINSVYGKMSLLGYSEVLAVNFLKNLISSCYTDTSDTENWPKLAQFLFNSIPYKYLESCLLNIVVNSNDYADVYRLLGDLVLSNDSFKYLISDKFLFMKTFNKEKSVQNLIGYLCEADKSRTLYYEVFGKLLNAWSTQTSIVNTSHEQHLYLTKCIIVCLAFSEERDKSILSQDLMGSLLKGVERHLHSPIESLRVLGMVVGENLMNDLNEMNFTKSDMSEKRLKFEYAETEETKSLNLLKTRPIKLEKLNLVDEALSTLDSLYETAAKSSSSDRTQRTLFENKNLNVKITVDEEDSDDDLRPYDLSNDVPLATLKQPAYLRDCLHALIYSDDPEKIEISLKSVENLCEKYHYELEEICVEMLKVILHKSNTYSMESFEETRMNAMISLTVHYPKESSSYLTSQFYEPGYTLTQRTDILNILVMSRLF